MTKTNYIIMADTLVDCWKLNICLDIEIKVFNLKYRYIN